MKNLNANSFDNVFYLKKYKFYLTSKNAFKYHGERVYFAVQYH